MEMKPKEIKKLRMGLMLTQKELAKQIGVAFCTLNRWENNVTTPQLRHLRKLKELEATTKGRK